MSAPKRSAAFEEAIKSLDAPDLPEVIGAIHVYPRVPSLVEILGSFSAGAEKVETPFGYFLPEDRDEILETYDPKVFEDLMRGA